MLNMGVYCNFNTGRSLHHGSLQMTKALTWGRKNKGIKGAYGLLFQAFGIRSFFKPFVVITTCAIQFKAVCLL
ncbi:hypothetical protein XENTR_v10001544 [Xenopus tropicalis]|nr:hypothetical protein XENTR_v10001544 [Xenopus tropicalis]